MYIYQNCCCLTSKSCPTLLWRQGLQSTRFLSLWDFPGKKTGMVAISLDGKESACNAEDSGLILEWGRCPGEGMATHSGILPGKLHGHRGLVGYSSGGHKRVTTEWLTLFTFSQGSFLTQGLTPHLQHWQVDSLPLRHQGLQNTLISWTRPVISKYLNMWADVLSQIFFWFHHRSSYLASCFYLY